MYPIKFRVGSNNDWPLVIPNLDGGVNYSVPSDAIKDNELSGALNFIFDPNSYRPIHRPGVVRYSNTVLPGSGTDLQVNGAVYSSILSKHLLSANQVLYYLDASKDPQSIGALSGDGQPSFLEFNGQVLIASGGTLQTTDGATIANVDNAPVLSKIFNKDGRVFGIGDTVNPHRLWGSGPGDETEWTGDAVYFDIEENVGDRIVNADVYKNNIIVFKGVQQRGIYALVVPVGVYTDAYVQEISIITSSVNTKASIECGNDLVFMDNNGIRSLVGVQNYGDIEQDPIGYKINSVILPSIDGNYAFMEINPYYDFVLIKYGAVKTSYAYNPTKKSFMPLQFEGLIPFSACYREDTKDFFIGMDDGFLYKMDKSIYTDNSAEVPAYFNTKKFTGKGGLTYLKVLKSVLFDYEGLSAGTATLEAVIDGGSKTISLLTMSLSAGHPLLFEGGILMYNDTRLLYGSSLASKQVTKFVNYYDVVFRVSNNTGAIKANRLEARSSTLRRRA